MKARRDESRYWSPQMRRWMGDAAIHGWPIVMKRMSGTGIAHAGFVRVTDDALTSQFSNWRVVDAAGPATSQARIADY